MPCARPALALALLAAALPAQVFIVDASNGAGTNFTDLPPAAAAVPDGATLRVRTGSYTPFALTGKGLRVIAEGAVQVTAAPGDIDIRATSAAQTVILRGLVLPYGAVRITDCQGPVVLEQCSAANPRFSSGAPHVEALRSGNVQIHECRLPPLTPFLGAPRTGVTASDSTLQISWSEIGGMTGAQAWTNRSDPGTPALELLRARCLLIASTLTGGAGGPGCRSCGLPGCSADGGGGGTGVVVGNSTLFVLGSAIVGGGGGHEGCCQGTCTCPGDGGTGIVVTSSRVLVFGVEPTGGAPGIGSPFCNARAGAPAVLNGTNDVVLVPTAQPPRARIVGTQTIGAQITFTILAPGGTSGALIAAPHGDLMPFEPFGIGSLLLPPWFSLPLTVPPSGAAQIAWTIPPTFTPGLVAFVQVLTLQPPWLWASNTFPLVVAS
jgi:hypothetical protein